MTYENDPVRWTSSLNDAPEELRGPLAASRNEGPSELQIKTLALKLAALSAGGAIAASAATAHAAGASATATATGTGTAAAVGGLSAAKLVASLAIVGAATAGLVVWHHAPSAPSARTAPGSVAAPHAVAPSVAPSADPLALPSTAPSQAAPRVVPTEPAQDEIENDKLPVEQRSAPARTPARGRATPKPTRVHKGETRIAQVAPAPVVNNEPVETQTAPETRKAVPSEVELLRRARAALAAHPREAYALAEQHRESYPRGVFAQERDALAVEALMRAGDMDRARELARRFIRAYPSSPVAHRFREAMKLP